jgi:hypothetical protein
MLSSTATDAGFDWSLTTTTVPPDAQQAQPQRVGACSRGQRHDTTVRTTREHTGASRTRCRRLARARRRDRRGCGQARYHGTQAVRTRTGRASAPHVGTAVHVAAAAVHGYGTGTRCGIVRPQTRTVAINSINTSLIDHADVAATIVMPIGNNTATATSSATVARAGTTAAVTSERCDDGSTATVSAALVVATARATRQRRTTSTSSGTCRGPRVGYVCGLASAL